LGSVTELQKEIKQLRERNELLTLQLSERPTIEGRENGIEEKVQKNSIQTVESTKM